MLERDFSWRWHVRRFYIANCDSQISFDKHVKPVVLPRHHTFSQGKDVTSDCLRILLQDREISCPRWECPMSVYIWPLMLHLIPGVLWEHHILSDKVCLVVNIVSISQLLSTVFDKLATFWRCLPTVFCFVSFLCMLVKIQEGGHKSSLKAKRFFENKVIFACQ